MSTLQAPPVSEALFPPRRETFVPVALDELLDDLLEQLDGHAEERELADVCRLYVALFRVRTQAALQPLRRDYRLFDPDREAVTKVRADAEGRTQALASVRAGVRRLLEQANFLPIAPHELDSALSRRSPRGLEVSVDLDAYDELGIFTRGVDVRSESVRDWRWAFLRTRTSEVPVFKRLFLLLKLKPGEDVEPRGAEHLHLRLFRDVAQSDLEMLLPTTEVRMTAFDKLKIAVTGGGGTVGGAVAVASKIGAAANPVTWVLALAGFVGVLWRQIARVFIQRTRYMAALARQLYFHTLDNNTGALMHLAELANAEECKEALLAYAFLARRGTRSSTRAELDGAIEGFLQERFGVAIDFDVDDGLQKLLEAELVRAEPDGRLSAMPTVEALERLNADWDEVFP